MNCVTWVYTQWIQERQRIARSTTITCRFCTPIGSSIAKPRGTTSITQWPDKYCFTSSMESQSLKVCPWIVVSLCINEYVLMISLISPQTLIDVSLWMYAFVLMLYSTCPHVYIASPQTCKDLSLCIYACVLMRLRSCWLFGQTNLNRWSTSSTLACNPGFTVFQNRRNYSRKFCWYWDLTRLRSNGSPTRAPITSKTNPCTKTSWMLWKRLCETWPFLGHDFSKINQCKREKIGKLSTNGGNVKWCYISWGTHVCVLLCLCMCPHSSMYVSLCLNACVLMFNACVLILIYMSPYVWMNVSSFWYVCLLMFICMCPHSFLHVSLCLYECLLMFLCMCPYSTHTKQTYLPFLSTVWIKT